MEKILLWSIHSSSAHCVRVVVVGWAVELAQLCIWRVRNYVLLYKYACYNTALEVTRWKPSLVCERHFDQNTSSSLIILQGVSYQNGFFWQKRCTTTLLRWYLNQIKKVWQVLLVGRYNSTPSSWNTGRICTVFCTAIFFQTMTRKSVQKY